MSRFDQALRQATTSAESGDADIFRPALARLEATLWEAFLRARRGSGGAPLPEPMRAKAMRCAQTSGDAPLRRQLALEARGRGALSEALGFATGADPDLAEHLDQQQRLCDWFERTLDRTQPGGGAQTDADTILYVLDNALPHHVSGYATRAAGLIVGWRAAGLRVVPVTRLGYPADRSDARAGDGEGEVLGRNDPRRNRRTLGPIDYVAANALWIRQAAAEAGASAIVSASYHWNGMAGLIAARALGLPHVYEVRGLEWLTRISQDPDFADSEEAVVLRRAEALVATRSDHVFAITDGLADALADKGVDRARLSLAPNGAAPVADRGSDRDGIVYAGSLLDYEGLDIALRAVAIARETVPSVRLDIAGAGAAAAKLEAMATDLGLGSCVRFHGRLGSAAAGAMHDRAQLSIIPRRSLPVTEAVAPMKFAESLARGCPVVASDVAPLAALVAQSGGGITFPAERPAALARRLVDLLGDETRVAAMARRGRRWVAERQNWQAIGADTAARLRDLVA